MTVYGATYLDDPEAWVKEELDKFAEEICYIPPNYAYYGELDPDRWGRLDFCVQHRDADVLSRANFKVISEDLAEHYPDTITVESSGHWAVGWVEVIRLDTQDRDALARALSWKIQLDDYPVADDDTFSEMETEQMIEDWESWGQDFTVDLIEEHPDPRIPAAFLDEEGELNEDGQEYAMRAFDEAWSDCGGDVSERYVAEHLGSYYLQMLEDKRVEFELYQPPLAASFREG